MEIGSVIELDDWCMYQLPENSADSMKNFGLPFMGAEKPEYKNVFYQSGRNAIEVLLNFIQKEFGVDAILIPDYVCGTVTDAVKRAGMEYSAYCINADLEVNVDEIKDQLDLGIKSIYVVHYFGIPVSQSLMDIISECRSKGIIVIEDITMALLSSGDFTIGFGDYIVGSLRKWFAIPDGGIICSKCMPVPDEPSNNIVSRYTNLYMLVQAMKREYVSGNFKNKNLKENYLEYYSESIKELFSDYRIYPMSEFSKRYIFNCNMDDIREKRIDNYNRLCDLVNGMNSFKVKSCSKDGAVPLGMWIECDNRDKLLQYLISCNIYCNVHWRLKESVNNPDIKFLADNVLTIPCDQRYSFYEMEYISEKLKVWEEQQ